MTTDIDRAVSRVMAEKLAKIGIGMIAVLIATPLVIAMALYHAVVLWLLWGWFMVPLGVPAIHIAWAIGIKMVANMLAPPQPRSEDTNKFAWWGPLFALAVGFIAKHWM